MLKDFKLAAQLGIATAVVVLAAVGITQSQKTVTKTVTKTTTVTKHVGAEPVYIRNLASPYITDATIKNDIPAWQRAINVDFAKYWHTTQYKLIFLGQKQAPHDGITAEFISKGPVKNALAYHWTERNNAPSITVYAGTVAYYGYNNSVAFTHELEELAADPVASFLNIGYPTGFFWIEDKKTNLHYTYNDAIGWFSEVSDPVEADSYTLPGADGTPVKISDFVTPAWFNDGIGTRYDFLGLCQQPLWIRPGGYAQYLSPAGWQIVENFRHGKHDDLWTRDHDNPKVRVKHGR